MTDLADDIKALIDQIISQELDGLIPVKGRPPLAFLVAGQPGSGKRRLAHLAVQGPLARPNGFIHIDADHLRARHPSYAELSIVDPDAAFAASQPFASDATDRLRLAAIDLRIDMIMEILKS